MEDYGFIILRHVRDVSTNRLWNECQRGIRKQQPPEVGIVIIDDASVECYVSAEQELVNTLIIKSEYPGAGEVLPYFYYAKFGWWSRAIFIHDSVLVNTFIDWNTYTEPAYKIWQFNTHGVDNIITEMRILTSVIDIESPEGQRLLQFYLDKTNWYGCFGGMAVMNREWVKRLDTEYPLKNICAVVNNREMRMGWERIVSVFLEYELYRLGGEYTDTNHNPNVFGEIFEYTAWRTSQDEYLQMRRNRPSELETYPLIKIQVGR